MIFFVAFVVLLLVGLCCLRVSDWHSSESQHWSHVALLVSLDPKLDAVHRPTLEWARANRPSIWERLKGWHSVEERMRRAGVNR